jgi:hypothetical protein
MLLDLSGSVNVDGSSVAQYNIYIYHPKVDQDGHGQHDRGIILINEATWDIFLRSIVTLKKYILLKGSQKNNIPPVHPLISPSRHQHPQSTKHKASTYDIYTIHCMHTIMRNEIT